MTKVQKRDPETGIRLQTWNKAATDILPITPNDSMQTAIQMGLESLERISSGQAPVYPNTEEGLQEFRKYTERYFHLIHDHNTALDPEERAMLPDVEGWAVFCGISRVTLFTYEKRGGEWGRYIGLVKDVIASAKKAAANDYKTPPVFTIFDLKCNHDYIEKTELKITTSAEVTEEQVQDALDSAGLKWDPDKNEYVAEDTDYAD